MPGGEAKIRVGVLTGRREISGCFHGMFRTPAGETVTGPFRFAAAALPAPRAGGGPDCSPSAGCRSRSGEDGGIIFQTREKRRPLPAGEGRFCPEGQAAFTLDGVAIGVDFHWERREGQTFQGALAIIEEEEGTLTAVNELGIEDYLASVISSEMAATAPLEFLKAHAVMSRSWLLAMLARKNPVPASGGYVRTHSPEDLSRTSGGGETMNRDSGRRAARGEDVLKDDKRQDAAVRDEIVRWYGREEHRRFDVCADDHCQRYQGVTKIVSPLVRAAIDATRDVVLAHGGRICDARYHKACGGRTEDFAAAWEDVSVPYLTSVADGPEEFPPVATDGAAAAWISSRPGAWCNTRDAAALREILPSFDRETLDFFRWQIAYDREELEDLLLKKAGIDFGELQALKPLTRGSSGRIIRLEIVGARRTVIVGKELEIRRWLSPSHLYSSAFVVATERDAQGRAVRFILRGAGWGHGVGLCQIGAAMMARRGYAMEYILGHYFPGATLRKRGEL